MTNEPLIPVLIAFTEGDLFKRSFITAKDFKKWRKAKQLLCAVPVNLHGRAGILNMRVSIIVTMNGFVYDKIFERETGILLRERVTFGIDLNELPRL